MNWLNKLERKFGRHYIENLMLIFTFGCAAFYLSSMVFGTRILSYFTLNPEKILQGQVWRLITFIFVTPSTSILFVTFAFPLALYIDPILITVELPDTVPV